MISSPIFIFDIDLMALVSVSSFQATMAFGEQEWLNLEVSVKKEYILNEKNKYYMYSYTVLPLLKAAASNFFDEILALLK